MNGVYPEDLPPFYGMETLKEAQREFASLPLGVKQIIPESSQVVCGLLCVIENLKSRIDLLERKLKDQENAQSHH